MGDYAGACRARDYRAAEIPKADADFFMHIWHYSGSCPPGAFYFGLFGPSGLCGAAVFGRPVGRNMAKRYFPEAPERLLELRRLALEDRAPKNAESFFVGSCLRILRRTKNWGAVISLADPNHGHSGGVYRAANFQYLGTEAGHGTRIFTIDGKDVHAKSAFDAYGTSGLKGLQGLLGPGRVTMRVPAPKHVYIFKL